MGADATVSRLDLGRLVRWLRLDKPGLDVARTKLGEVRAMLAELGDDLWTIDPEGRDVPTIMVTQTGKVIVVTDETPRTVGGQEVLEGALDLFAPFETGVDLRRPRPRLRMHPGRLGGEPHLAGSRVTSLAVVSLSRRGMILDRIAMLYPHEDPAALGQAIDLEEQLSRAAA